MTTLNFARRSLWWGLVGVLIGGVMLPACHTPLTDRIDDTVLVSVQGAEGPLPRTVALLVDNRSSENVLFEVCGPSLIYSLERMVSSEWEVYSSSACLAIYAPEFGYVLEPGARAAFSVEIEDEGRYRHVTRYVFESRPDDPQTIVATFEILPIAE